MINIGDKVKVVYCLGDGTYARYGIISNIKNKDYEILETHDIDYHFPNGKITEVLKPTLKQKSWFILDKNFRTYINEEHNIIKIVPLNDTIE